MSIGKRIKWINLYFIWIFLVSLIGFKLLDEPAKFWVIPFYGVLGFLFFLLAFYHSYYFFLKSIKIQAASFIGKEVPKHSFVRKPLNMFSILFPPKYCDDSELIKEQFSYTRNLLGYSFASFLLFGILCFLYII